MLYACQHYDTIILTKKTPGKTLVAHIVNNKNRANATPTQHYPHPPETFLARLFAAPSEPPGAKEKESLALLYTRPTPPFLRTPDRISPASHSMPWPSSQPSSSHWKS